MTTVSPLSSIGSTNNAARPVHRLADARVMVTDLATGQPVQLGLAELLAQAPRYSPPINMTDAEFLMFHLRLALPLVTAAAGAHLRTKSGPNAVMAAFMGIESADWGDSVGVWVREYFDAHDAVLRSDVYGQCGRPLWKRTDSPNQWAKTDPSCEGPKGGWSVAVGPDDVRFYARLDAAHYFSHGRALVFDGAKAFPGNPSHAVQGPGLRAHAMALGPSLAETLRRNAVVGLFDRSDRPGWERPTSVAPGPEPTGLRSFLTASFSRLEIVEGRLQIGRGDDAVSPVPHPWLVASPVMQRPPGSRPKKFNPFWELSQGASEPLWQAVSLVGGRTCPEVVIHAREHGRFGDQDADELLSMRVMAPGLGQSATLLQGMYVWDFSLPVDVNGDVLDTELSDLHWLLRSMMLVVLSLKSYDSRPDQAQRHGVNRSRQLRRDLEPLVQEFLMELTRGVEPVTARGEVAKQAVSLTRRAIADVADSVAAGVHRDEVWLNSLRSAHRRLASVRRTYLGEPGSV